MIKRNIINEAINELVKTSQKSRFHNNGSFHYKVDANAVEEDFHHLAKFKPIQALNQFCLLKK